MADFIFFFILSNFYIGLMIVLLFLAKRVFRRWLSARMRYRLWHILFVILCIPLLPPKDVIIPILSHFPCLQNLSNAFSWTKKAFHAVLVPSFTSNTGTMIVQASPSDWLKDFGVSIGNGASSNLANFLLFLWIVGICLAAFRLFRAYLLLLQLKQSTLPMENETIIHLYEQCKKELKIKREIPLSYSDFIKSPVIAGIFKPHIYMPLHVVSQYSIEEIRFMLLHELWHYKQKDLLWNSFSNIVGILYWFHPLVHFAKKEMRHEQELSCDALVLSCISENSYMNYGSTIIACAEKLSLSHAPFALSMGSTFEQLKSRITHILAYEKPSLQKSWKGLLIFILIVILLTSFTPNLFALSVSVGKANSYSKKISDNRQNTVEEDFSDYFEETEGCFVLYDSKNDTWHIYNEEMASRRKTPVSTYKIYSSLCALENKLISPTQNDMSWNGEKQAFSEWERTQDLSSAMKNSVNWYFQNLDAQLGSDKIRDYLNNIQYGNQSCSNSHTAYWSDGSLTISPIEQVVMLQKFYRNDFHFQKENIDAVKQAILLETSGSTLLYGKTGTGQVNGENALGWFVGYVQKEDNVYYFATQLQNTIRASGSTAAGITTAILKDQLILE